VVSERAEMALGSKQHTGRPVSQLRPPQCNPSGIDKAGVVPPSQDIIITHALRIPTHPPLRALPKASGLV
jgi:hypothetical protein